MNIYDFIKEKEGFRDQAYDDAVGVRTIGYGRTGGSFEPTTREAEDAWLKKRVDSEKRFVEKYAKDHGYDWSPQQIDALSSFTFNLGRGRLDQLTQGGERDNATIGQKIRLYNKAGGRELAGLVTRRNEEAAMFSGNPGGVPQSTFPGPHATVPSPQPTPPRVGPSFNEAFAQARQAQGSGGQFEWDGNFYTTNLKEEEDMKHNKYNKGTRKVDPSAVSNAIIHTADTIAPWAAMLFGRGTMEVPGYRRGSSVVLTEEERKRREEARKAAAGNTSKGRNAGRDNLSKEDFEWQPPAMLNIPPNPNSSDAPVVVGEEPVWRTNQMRGLHPGTGQGTAPTVATGTPVQHPNASAKAQQTGVMNAAEREDYWQRVWVDSGGMNREAKAAYEQARQERMALQASFGGGGDPRTGMAPGSLTDTSVHSAIGGRPDTPTGDLTNAAYTGPATSGGAVDPRTGLPTGNLTNAAYTGPATSGGAIDPRTGLPTGALPGAPLQHPNASAQAQQTEVMNLDQRAAYWRDVWNKSGGMDRNAEAQYKAAIAERQQIKDNQAAAVQASDANQAAAWMQQSADPAAFDNTPSDAWTQAQQEALQSEPPKPNAYSGFSTKDLVEMYSRDPSPELADELQNRPDLDQGIEEAKSYVSSGNVEGRQVADEKAARDAEKADALRIEKEKQAALIDKKREEGTLTQFDIDKDKRLAEEQAAAQKLAEQSKKSAEELTEAHTKEEKAIEEKSKQITAEQQSYLSTYNPETGEFDYEGTPPKPDEEEKESEPDTFTPTDSMKAEEELMAQELSGDTGATTHTTPSGDKIVVDSKGKIYNVSTGKPIDTPTPTPEQEGILGGLFENLFGLNNKDLTQAIGMYMLSRLAGSSHGGAMEWAGNAVLENAASRRATEEEDARVKKEEDRKIKALMDVGYTKEEANAAVIAGVTPKEPSAPKISATSQTYNYNGQPLEVRWDSTNNTNVANVNGVWTPVDVNSPGWSKPESYEDSDAVRADFDKDLDSTWNSLNSDLKDNQKFDADVNKVSEDLGLLYADYRGQKDLTVEETQRVRREMTQAGRDYLKDVAAWRKGQGERPSSVESYVNRRLLPLRSGVSQNDVKGTSQDNFEYINQAFTDDALLDGKLDAVTYNAQWDEAKEQWKKVKSKGLEKDLGKVPDGYSGFTWFVYQSLTGTEAAQRVLAKIAE